LRQGAAYLERAAPRRAAPVFLALGFEPGLFIVPGPGSNFPGWTFCSGWSALAFRFLAFFAAFAFARWRAFALVMCFSLSKKLPFKVRFYHYRTGLGQIYGTYSGLWRR